ncbi:MAG: SPOR domain-containing protein [Gammaproteobacteria bacterium]
MVKPTQTLALTILSLSLAGCALPAAVKLGLLAGGAASYLTTGKGLSDHAVSAALEEDCAWHRIVTEGALCRDDEHADSTLTSVEEPGQIAATKMAASPTSEDTVAPSSEISVAGAASPQIYLVIGSFRIVENAERYRVRHEAFNSHIVTTEIGGERRYRVVAGPFKDKNVELARSLLAAAGATDSWPLYDVPAFSSANRNS